MMGHRLSQQQFYALHLGANYRILRSAIGWWAWDKDEVDARHFIHRNTVRSLLKKGLLEVVFTSPTGRSEVRTNELGKIILGEITEDTGLVFDPETDDFVVVPYLIERRVKRWRN